MSKNNSIENNKSMKNKFIGVAGILSLLLFYIFLGSFMVISFYWKDIKSEITIRENRKKIEKSFAENELSNVQLSYISRAIENNIYYEELEIFLTPNIPINNLEVLYDMIFLDKLKKKQILEILENVPNGIYGNKEDILNQKKKYLILRKIKK